MWAAQHYYYDEPNSLISSGGLGTMGYGLPASIGVQFARPDTTVWCLDGDGSFQMTIQELATIQQERLPIKIALFNNGFLGMVRQWQELFFEKRYVATPLSGPDFIKVADAYGIPGLRVEHRNEVAPAIEKAMSEPGAFVIDFRVEPEENVYPMVRLGGSLVELLEDEQIKKEATRA
jgi:acetolactate synthase-1/2/3 large subunit